MAGHPHRIAFYVQHLLGIGHLYRARRICDALHQAGANVTMISGGEPAKALDHAPFEVVQLPPIRSGDVGFTGLVDTDGQPIDETFKAQRRDALLAAIDTFGPDIVVTEAFPFGRRQVRFELIPLLERIGSRPADTRPRLFASVRDLLQEGRKRSRDEETVDTLNQHYDGVLVHGDPAISTLADTFPLASEIAIPVHDTGLIGPDPTTLTGSQSAHPAHDIPNYDIPTYDIIVSAGGGAVGRELLMAAAEAAAQDQLPDGRIALVTGPNAPQSLADDLRKATMGKADIVPFIPNLPGALARARLSISQAGYNTVADILLAGCASVLVPFATGGETEQTRRAVALQTAGRAVLLGADDLSSNTLAQATIAALRQDTSKFSPSLRGAERTAAILMAS